MFRRLSMGAANLAGMAGQGNRRHGPQVNARKRDFRPPVNPPFIRDGDDDLAFRTDRGRNADEAKTPCRSIDPLNPAREPAAKPAALAAPCRSGTASAPRAVKVASEGRGVAARITEARHLAARSRRAASGERQRGAGSGERGAATGTGPSIALAATIGVAAAVA
jgi:hypothetical protein